MAKWLLAPGRFYTYVPDITETQVRLEVCYIVTSSCALLVGLRTPRGGLHSIARSLEGDIMCFSLGRQGLHSVPGIHHQLAHTLDIALHISSVLAC
jgi:hypothetical protein